MPTAEEEADQVLDGGEAVADARTIPVQRMRPGDHAFSAYDGGQGRWEVLAAFVRQGLLTGEKVLVLLDPQPPAEELLWRLHARTPAVQRAWETGQLKFTSMRALLHPERDFTIEGQWRGIAEETQLALRQGYRALRTYADMGWIAELGADLEAVLRREHSSAHLFAGRPYSEVCAYDRQFFSADILGRLARAHPRNLLGDLGSLHAVHGIGTGARRSVRLVGEADVTTSVEFMGALRTALTPSERAEAARKRRTGTVLEVIKDTELARAEDVTVDLTSLHFISVGCAAGLLRLCAQSSNVAIRCTPFQARLLLRLGADSVRSVALAVEEVE
jgi:hypothetical protein